MCQRYVIVILHLDKTNKMAQKTFIPYYFRIVMAAVSDIDSSAILCKI